MTGDFNLFFDSKSDVKGRNPTLKKQSLTKFIEFLKNRTMESKRYKI